MGVLLNQIPSIMKKYLLHGIALMGLAMALSCVSEYPYPGEDQLEDAAQASDSNDSGDQSDDTTPENDPQTGDAGADATPPPEDPPLTDPDAGKVTYLADVVPIMNQLCVACHNASLHEDGVDLSTYELTKLNFNDILESMQEEEGEDDLMPPGVRVDNAIIQTLLAWKYDGLLEGQAPAADPIPLPPDGSLSFTANILTVFEDNCIMCHNATVPAGGFDMSTYQKTVDQIDLIMARMELQSGQTGVMPPAGQLDAATLQMIQAWIDQGMPE
jgi:mono/diheme cytochrome c family protein